ncbi:MAG: lamin tail domain-containing protein, partial [Patescibacteria group bacterium]
MNRTVYVLLIVLILVPISSLPLHAASTDIVINEIAASESSDHEWIEIYNKGTAAIDLTGWKFFEENTNHGLSAFRGDMTIDPGEYAVIADVAANTAADYPSFAGTILDSSWSTLTESGESLALKDNTGTIIEQFTYIPGPNHSLERVDATLADYTATNWKEHTSGNTIGALNTASVPITTPPVEPPPAEPPPTEPPVTPPITPPATPPSEAAAPSVSYAHGDMFINEFVSDPGDEEIEWIELYNPQSKDIDLTGWTIEDGSKTKTNLSGTIGTSANDRFFIIENPKGKLNNAGDLIILRDPNGTPIDEVVFGNWDDGNTLNNAPAANDPSATARAKDGNDSFNNSFDFRITTKPTKGSSNVIIDPDVEKINDARLPFIKDIIISELLPDPIGTATKNEFIELYNKGDKDINLAGWEIVNAAGRKYIVDTKKLKDTTIKTKGYFVFERPITGLALKNTGGDSITLYQPDGEKPNATFSYKEKTTQGHAYAFFPDQGSSWTTTPTPGAVNIKTLANEPPDPDMEMPTSGAILEELIFDASDTTDPEQDTLTYAWDFGDGQKGEGVQLSHHYTSAGRYKVSLTVKDPTNEKKATKTIVIAAVTQTTTPQPMTKIPEEEIPQSITGISPIVINEVAPNPKGSDVNEFIELANISNAVIDISGWRVTYQLGKKSYTFPTTSTI